MQKRFMLMSRSTFEKWFQNCNLSALFNFTANFFGLDIFALSSFLEACRSANWQFLAKLLAEESLRHIRSNMGKSSKKSNLSLSWGKTLHNTPYADDINFVHFRPSHLGIGAYLFVIYNEKLWEIFVAQDEYEMGKSVSAF